MTYNVQIMGSGYLAWKFLERTEDKQREIFGKSAEIARERDYYREKMPNVKDAEQLVSDRRLLNVTLRAFGLEGDLSNRAFIKKVLDADVEDPTSIVNKLSDKKYLALNQAFSKIRAGTEESSDELSGILENCEARLFERNIGERYPDIEISLNAQREIERISERDTSVKTKWYEIIASKPLRKFFETAFGYRISGLSVDRQVDQLSRSLEKMIGASDPSKLLEKSLFDKVNGIYLARSSANLTGVESRYSIALTLLR